MKRYMFILAAIVLTITSCSKEQLDYPEGFDETSSLLRIATEQDARGLDPRQIRDLPTINILRMLYEGLLYVNSKGKPDNGLAKSYEVSQDLKTYTFKLRKSGWSNGDELTAHDFVRTLLSTLDPKTASPIAYQLDVIQGAKEARQGKIPLNEVAIRAIGEDTIEISLSEPTPYFLDLVCTHLFFPVHPQSTAESPIVNGPFKVMNWKRNHELVLKRNEHFWNAEEVGLDGIVLQVLEPLTALRLFESHQLEWAGSPLSIIPVDILPSLKKRGELHTVTAAGTHWFRINTEAPPFNNIKMRRAFGLSLNRNQIVKHVTLGEQKPATAIVPASFGLHKSYFDDSDIPKAWYAFQEALQELGLSKDNIPAIKLCYATNERNQKIAQAVQQQWKKELGIVVELEQCESQLFFEKLNNKEYHVALGSWYADIRDPINFLEIFKYKSNSTNSTGWENSDYIELLNRSSKEANVTQRLKLLDDAQKLLLDQMPVIPLFYGSFNYTKNSDLVGVYFCDLGFIDLRYAFYTY